MPASATVHFRDVRGSKQTAILYGLPAMSRADRDYYPAIIMNFRLGGGGFTSRLVREVREKRGFTSSIRSRFEPSSFAPLFTVETSVRTDATAEAARLIRDILRDYPATFTDEDLALTKESLTKSRARASETASAKLRILADIGDFGLPVDYQVREDAEIAATTTQSVRDLAKRYVQTNHMNYVFVGDANSQLEPIKALNLGPTFESGDPSASHGPSGQGATP
jgi:zinc protease